MATPRLVATVAGLRSAIEDLLAGAPSLELRLKQAVVNRALAATGVTKLLADNRLHDLDVAFTAAGVVVGVVPRVGPLSLPRRRYTLPIAARRGYVEIDLGEVLRIPVVGAKIAARLDDTEAWPAGLSIRRRGNVLAVGHPRFRCERAVCEDGTVDVTLRAAEGRRRS
jgi:hypothetical protein